MPKILNVKQGSDEWFEARRGVITATRAADLLNKTKTGKYTAKRETALCEIAMERLGGIGRPPVTSKTMERGHAQEDDAAIAYEVETGRSTEVVGFMIHDKHPLFGCSPDRIIAGYGLLEIKAPMCLKKMVSYILHGDHYDEYFYQITHQCYVSGVERVDIIGYDPRAANGFQTAIRTFTRPDSWAEYEALLMAADNAIEDMVEKLKSVQAQKIAA